MREEFRVEPKNKKVVQGETIILECGPPRGHPEPVVYWKKNDQDLDLDSNKRYVHMSELHALFVVLSRVWQFGSKKIGPTVL